MRKRLSLLVVILFGLLTVLVACGGSKLTVTFDTQGGSEVQAVKVDSGSKVARPSENPTKAGFDFDNWYEDKDGKNLFNFDEPITKNVTVYAVWVEEGFQLSDQEIVDKVKNELTLGNLSNLTNDSPRIILPVQKDGATITWAIDKTEYISAAGVVSQPENEVGNQVVTITATIKKGEATATKKFSATVVALPPASEAEALLDETFKDFEDGNILDQVQTVGVWAPVSGKTGNSTFNVVSGQVEGQDIPNGSKALKMNSWGELQIETALVHDLDVIVVEADLLQTPGAGAIHIQNGTGGDRVTFAFGITGSEPYYRVGVPNPQVKLGSGFADSKWHTFRAELNTKDQTFELFVYENGNLKSLSGLVSYEGNVVLDTLILRTGSSNETSLREASSYVTNIKVNRIEALPRPEVSIKLGEITGIEESKNIEVGQDFVADVPVVKGLYGSDVTLVKDTDYSLEVLHEIDKDVAGEYVVTYKFVNLHDETDEKSVTQTVTYFSADAPNEIQSQQGSRVLYEEGTTDLSVTVVQPSGTLYYLVSDVEVDADAIKASGIAVEISKVDIEVKSVEIAKDYKVYLVVESTPGFSQIKVVDPARQEVEEISTAQQFYDMTIAEKDFYYILTNDIDFEGFAWTYANKKFIGVLNGQNFTVKNLTIAESGDRAGIFSRLHGGTIKNLVIDNADITSAGRVGILVGEVGVAKGYIENVVVANSKVKGAKDEGVAGLVGFITKSHLSVTNVAVINTDVETTAKTVSSVIGRVEGNATTPAHLDLEDVYVNGGTITSTSTATSDVGVSALVGYLRSQYGTASVKRAVVSDVKLVGPMAGAVIGYARDEASATFEDIYVDADLTIGDVRAGIIGRYNEVTNRFDLSDVYGSLAITPADLEPHAQAHQLDEANVILPSAVTRAIIEEKFALSAELWDVKDNGLPVLKLASTFLLPKHLVTFVFEEGLEQENITKLVTEGQPLVFVAPEFTGYEYVGLFTDEARTNALPEDFVVAAEITLYVKYNAATTAVVTFDTVGGDEVEPITVNVGEALTEFPTVPNKEFDGVLKKVVKWQLNDEDFALSTPVTSNITLVAVWEDVTYNVTVDGVKQLVQHGSTAIEPAKPIPSLFADSLEFDTWIVGGTPFDFATPVTSDLVILSKNKLKDGLTAAAITTIEEFYYITTNNFEFDLELANDLDFSEFTWTHKNHNASINLDGKGFTIKNLNISTANDRVGIFARFKDGSIKNLILDNVKVDHTGNSGRVGVLIAESSGNVLIENVVIKNSNATGERGEGVAGFVGYANGGVVNVKTSAIITATIHNRHGFAAGIVGRTKGEVNITDVYVKDLTTKQDRVNNEAGSASIVAFIDSSAATVNLNRVVIDDHKAHGHTVAGVIGYIKGGSITMTDVFVSSTLTGTHKVASLIGRYNPVPTELMDASDVYGFTNETNIHAESQQLDAENVVTEEELVASFWTEKVTLSDTLWTIPETGIPVLKIAE